MQQITRLCYQYLSMTKPINLIKIILYVSGLLQRWVQQNDGEIIDKTQVQESVWWTAWHLSLGLAPGFKRPVLWTR